MRKMYSIGIYEKAFPETCSLLEMLNLARETGYDFFELSIDRTEQRIHRIFDSEYENEIQSAVEKSGVPISSMGLSAIGTYTLGNPDPSISEKGMDIFRHAVSFAERMGIRVIQIPACDMPKFDPRDKETDKRFICNLKKVMEYATSHAVLIGLENMENDYMDSVDKCMRAIKTINSPYLQLYPDLGNITNAWDNNLADIICDLDVGTGHYIAVHAKEVQPTRYGGLFYGEGRVDFKTLIAKAYSLGIRRFVMEYWYTGNESWKQDLITARKLMDSWITKQEVS